MARPAPGDRPGARVGRPRAGGPAPAGDPREPILDAAASLFTTVGYARTTTRAVAAASGLRQPSLFHYFPTKEHLLAELLDRTVAPAAQFLTWLRRQDAPPEVKLAALVWRDTETLCRGPYNLGALQLLPEARSDRFAPFWAKRARLRRGYRELVQACGAARPDVAAELTFGLVESVIVWYRRGGTLTPHDVADQVTIGALALATGRGGTFATTRRRAEALLASAPTEPVGSGVPGTA